MGVNIEVWPHLMRSNNKNSDGGGIGMKLAIDKCMVVADILD